MENNLAKIQALLKVPKSNTNAFGGYKFRSAEDILEAVKPIVNPLGFYVGCTDDVVEIGGRVYVKATAKLSDGNEVYTADGFAREDESQKGMSVSQITGSASSYARKYALNGLFAIDDTKDPDATNDHSDKKETKVAPQKTETPKPEAKKSWLNPGTKEWDHSVTRIKEGIKIEDVEKFFLLSKENKTKLLAETK